MTIPWHQQIKRVFKPLADRVAASAVTVSAPQLVRSASGGMHEQEQRIVLRTWSDFVLRLHRFCSSEDPSCFGTVSFHDATGVAHSDPALASHVIHSVEFKSPARKGVWAIEQFVKLRWRLEFEHLMSAAHLTDASDSALATELLLRKSNEEHISHLSFLYSACKLHE